MLRYLVLLFAALSFSAPVQASSLQQDIDAIGANVIFMRHALAPGTGDPARFDLSDCSTQRNLDQRGRQQARDLGDYFRNHNVQPTAILSSGWCRCYQTAELLELGDYDIHPGLHSFYGGHVDRTQTLAALQERFDSLDSEELILMVTHQVVITAATGVFPASGEMVLLNTQTGQAQRVHPVPAR